MNLNEERVEENNSNLINYQFTNQSINTINNVTYSVNDDKFLKKPLFTGDSEGFCNNFPQEINDNFPTYLSNCATITIPKKVKRSVSRLPKGVLNKIDNDKNIAIEKCLDFVSNFTGTIFYEDQKDKWRNLSSKYLDETYRKGKNNTRIYRRIINSLQYSTNSTYPIIEIKKNEYGNESYMSNEFSKAYRLTSHFESDTLVNYNLKNEDLISKKRKKYLEKISDAIKNDISRNLLQVYKAVELPTLEQIENRGDELIGINYRTKKGKLIARLSNRKKEKIKDFKSKSFVEENIKQFNYLTKNGLFIPIIGGFKSGGRVVDSFTLMPSWIRELIKIDGENVVEVDFKALHPNLCMCLYGGESKYLTHKQVADYLGKSLNEVKIEHLSFFNKHPNEMEKSLLFEYYLKNESEMLNRLISDKQKNGYKVSSRKFFKLEVEIMNEAIKRLNSEGIYLIYVYDALVCKISHRERVKQVMNQVVLDFKVYTIAE